MNNSSNIKRNFFTSSNGNISGCDASRTSGSFYKLQSHHDEGNEFNDDFIHRTYFSSNKRIPLDKFSKQKA